MSTIRVTLCFSFLQLFLWVGKDANAEEKTGAPKIGLLHENLTGRGKKKPSTQTKLFCFRYFLNILLSHSLIPIFQYFSNICKICCKMLILSFRELSFQ